MRLDLFNIKIDNEKQLIEFVNQLNMELANSNSVNSEMEQETLINIGYILKRYRKIKEREEKKVFREVHDCEYCLYYRNPRRCSVTKWCPMESGNKTGEKEVSKLPICPKDKEGNCPYGNEIGTCFGFCLQKILSEFNKK